MLGALCQFKGPEVYISCQEVLLKSVSENLERKLPHDSEAPEWVKTDVLVHKLAATHQSEPVCTV